MAGALYHPIYLFLVFILTVYVMKIYAQPSVDNSHFNYSIDELADNNFIAKSPYHIFSFILAIGLALFIGFRPICDEFVDMVDYNYTYSYLMGSHFFFDFDVDNLIYDNWFTYMASNNVPVRVFFLIVSIVYFGLIWLACRKLFTDNTLLAFLVYLAALSTFTYATNGIKAGMATSIFLCALAYYDKPLISVPIALLTYGMHHSMLLVIVAYFCVLLVKNPKYYFIVWGVSFCMAALHITWFQHYFAGFTDEHGASYLLSSRNSGFRIDFIIYSAVPVIIGYWMIFKNNLYSRTYDIILNLYLLTNSVWMLCMYSNFTNRIAYLSWFIYPIVLLYPFVNLYWSDRQDRYLKYVVYGHLGFTMFMNFVYS